MINKDLNRALNALDALESFQQQGAHTVGGHARIPECIEQMKVSLRAVRDHLSPDNDISRVEVIGEAREYVNMNTGNVMIDYQDDGRTLKVFVQKGCIKPQPTHKPEFGIRPTDLQSTKGYQATLKIGVQTLYFLVRETEEQAVWYKRCVIDAINSLAPTEEFVRGLLSFMQRNNIDSGLAPDTFLINGQRLSLDQIYNLYLESLTNNG